jgi:MFS family permease
VLAGLIGAAANVGYLTVALLALVITPEGYWRVLLVFCALPALLTFLIRMFVPESEAWRHAAASGPKARLTDVFVPALRGRAFAGAAAGAVALLATWGAVQFTQLWAQSMTGDAVAGAYVQIVSSAGAIVGAFLAPVLLQHVGRRAGYCLLCLAALAASEFLFLGHDAFGARFLLAVALTGVTTFKIDVQGRYAEASAIVCLVYVIGMGLAWALPETKGRPLPE